MKIGIFGYGNLGRGVELAVNQNDDMEVAAVFTRRNPETVKTAFEKTKVYNVDEVDKFYDDIDVMIMCGGSATDLPSQSKELVKHFNIVDSYDNHAQIVNHYRNVNEVALKSEKIGLISCGWDPGMFSLNRLYARSILANSSDYTFWGRGVSQGHSDAIRRIEGVIDAKQYTIPVEEAMNRVRAGEYPELSADEKHIRECFVVIKEGYDENSIREQIVTMPDYFAPYKVIVNFISKEEFDKNHSSIPHAGNVIVCGKTGVNQDVENVIEYSLKLSSNPEFTASVLVAYARAVYRMNKIGMSGAKTVFDVAPAFLSKYDGEDLISKFL